MSNAPIEGGLVSFTIKVDGSAISDTIEIASIHIAKELKETEHCVIAIHDGSMADQRFEVSESSTFDIGRKIEVLAGYDGKNESLFTGKITAQDLEINVANAQLHIQCEESSEIVTAPDESSSPVFELSYGTNVFEANLSLEKDHEPRGFIKTQGTSRVQLGDVVTLHGFGDRFNSNRPVTGVHQAISEGNWFTSLDIG